MEQQEVEGEPVQPERRLLQDLEHYIRSNGIEGHIERRPDEAVSAERVREEANYQDLVHRSIFGQGGAKSEEQAEKERFLGGLKGKTIVVRAGGVVLDGTPLDRLAASCDTVYALARSMPLFVRTGVLDDAGGGNLELDLSQFQSDAVRDFVSVVVDGRFVEEVPADNIVEVCRIAHYVQCPEVLDRTVDILKESIDSNNCISICHLADALEVPSLFETAVGYLISTLDNMQEHEHWDDFPKSLQMRIITMRNAVQSSILGRGQKSSVFFSSSEEFLAIFSDNIREQRERLSEAKRRQDEVIQERLMRGGRHRDPMGGSVRDAAAKIDRQERRIETLEVFYREQKTIFSGRDKISPFSVGF